MIGGATRPLLCSKPPIDQIYGVPIRIISSSLNASTTLALVLGALLFLGSGCNDAAGPVDPTDLTFAPQLGVDLATMTRSSTGLYYKDLTVGTGAQTTTGASVTVDYTGWLHNGTQFDSSAGTGPITITSLGSGQVIAGWDEGLMGMRAGGSRLLVIPSRLGYGAAGSGPIPGNATIVFRVDLRTVVPR
jgi:FKBP-type peptidyl-prolyl cis-trans isomerase FkpA